jgi:hypothetical protein
MPGAAGIRSSKPFLNAWRSVPERGHHCMEKMRKKISSKLQKQSPEAIMHF